MTNTCVRSGSKAERLSASKCDPVFSDKQTSRRSLGTSAWCQKQTSDVVGTIRKRGHEFNRPAEGPSGVTFRNQMTGVISASDETVGEGGGRAPRDASQVR